MKRTIPVYGADVESLKPLIERELNGEGGSVGTETLERARRFLRIDDAYRCIGAELLRDRALRGVTGIDPAGLRVARDERNKPYLSDVPDVHFNVSHSGNLILCAVDRYPVGVDVETMRSIDRDVAMSCFTPLERMRLETDERNGTWNEFYRLWTLKESYLKALGTGLSRDPLTVEIRPLDEAALLWTAGDDYTMRVLTVPDGYAGAVCGRGEFESGVMGWFGSWVVR